jgi:ABC-type lipoprotein release transport system permease subunit
MCLIIIGVVSIVIGLLWGLLALWVLTRIMFPRTNKKR